MDLKGKTVVQVYQMTEQEMIAEGWDYGTPPTVIRFNDGSKVFASRDEEGNGPGAMFGQLPNGDQVYVYPDGPGHADFSA